MAVLSTANTGQYLTADQVMRMLVLPLEHASVFLSAGPRIFDVTAAGPVHIPTLTGSTTPSWVGENELIPDSDVTFSEVVLLDGIKSLKVISKFSSELVRSSVISLEAAVQQRIVQDVAAQLDTALIAGTGAGSTPVGLLSYTGVQTTAIGGALTIDHLHDAIGKALTAAVDTTRLKWVMTPWVLTSLRKLKTVDGVYLLQPDPTQAGGFRLLGLPVIVTTRIPTGGAAAFATTVVLADFSTIAVARDMAPTVTLLRERYAEYDQVAIRVICRMDAAPLLPQAVIKLTGVTGGAA